MMSLGSLPLADEDVACQRQKESQPKDRHSKPGVSPQGSCHSKPPSFV